MKPGGMLKETAASFKFHITALLIAYRDPRMPWYAKAFSFMVLAYALSPIDLIPDFIPVLGQLDDLVLIPLGIVLAIKMIPAQVLIESRIIAKARVSQRLPRSKFGLTTVVFIWLIGLIAGGFAFFHLL